MYAKNLQISVLSPPCGPSRQVAKEKGVVLLDGGRPHRNYYQWFQAQKIKGDVKDHFINDYLLWMLKESEGNTEALREVRSGGICRSQEVKAKLKPRAIPSTRNPASAT